MCRVPMLATAAGWRWWLTDCHCSCNWQSTPRSCACCTATADHGEEPPRWMGWPFWKPRGPRNEGTLSSSACRHGRVCCGSWVQILEGDTGSSEGWPRHGAKHHSCRGVMSRHGECDGLGCSVAQRRKLWLHLFWRCKMCRH